MERKSQVCFSLEKYRTSEKSTTKNEKLYTTMFNEELCYKINKKLGIC